MTTQPQARTTQPPIRKLRLGSLSANIWQRDVEAKSFYSVTIEKSYRDADGEYKSTHSFSWDDLPLLTKLADQAFNLICEFSTAQVA